MGPDASKHETVNFIFRPYTIKAICEVYVQETVMGISNSDVSYCLATFRLAKKKTSCIS